MPLSFFTVVFIVYYFIHCGNWETIELECKRSLFLYKPSGANFHSILQHERRRILNYALLSNSVLFG